MKMNTDRVALIAGSTGIVGRNLAALASRASLDGVRACAPAVLGGRCNPTGF